MLGALAVGSALALTAAMPSAMAQGFYEGKTVTVIMPHSPSGGQGQYGRMIQPFLEKHLKAKEVRLEFHPGAGSLLGTNLIWKARPDGRTIGFVVAAAPAMAQLAESPGVQFKFGEFTFLGNANKEPKGVWVGKESKFQAAKDLVESKVEFRSASQGTDDDFYALNVIAKTLNFPIKIISGYEGEADVVLATIKDDSDGFMSSYTNQRASMEAGDLKSLLLNSPERSPQLPDTPTVLEIVPAGTDTTALRTIMNVQMMGRAFIGPPGMDPEAVKEMRAGIAAALADPELLEVAKAQQKPIIFVSGEDDQVIAKQIEEGGTALTPILKEAVAAIK
jgi:tripartite-type tricarboxylate transporter receptor subunit TctC